MGHSKPTTRETLTPLTRCIFTPGYPTQQPQAAGDSIKVRNIDSSVCIQLSSQRALATQTFRWFQNVLRVLLLLPLKVSLCTRGSVPGPGKPPRQPGAPCYIVPASLVTHHLLSAGQLSPPLLGSHNLSRQSPSSLWQAKWRGGLHSLPKELIWLRGGKSLFAHNLMVLTSGHVRWMW